MIRLAAVLLAALPLAAAPPKGTPLHVRIPVWVNGEGTLLQSGVKASIGGSRSQVTSVRGPSDSLMVLLVMDVVGDLASIEPAKQALAAEIRKLPPNTWAGVLRAQDGLKVLADPSPDRERSIEAIQGVPAAGTAGLLENVELAGRIADSILTKTGVRAAVLYVTDSTVHNYREDFTNPVINSSDAGDLSRRFPERLIQEKISKIEDDLARQQAPLFIAHLDYRNDRMNEAYQIGLKRLAETTGGSAVFCRTRGDIPGVISGLLSSIVSHYSVTLAVPRDAPRNASLELTADGAPALTYRQRLTLKEK